MTQEGSQQGMSISSIDEGLQQLRYARAAELARSGNYREAEKLLIPDDRLPEAPNELDLLARIAARQERFEDAVRLWNMALQHDPGSQAYKENLQRLLELQANQEPADLPKNVIVPWCIAATAVLLLGAHLLFSNRPRASKPAVGTTTNEIHTAGTSASAAGTNTATFFTPTPSAQTVITEITAAVTESAAAVHRVEENIAQLQRNQQAQAESLKAQLAAIQATNGLLFAYAGGIESRFPLLVQSVEEISSNQALIRQSLQSARTDLASLLAADTQATNQPPERPILEEFKPNIPGVTVIHTTNGCFIAFEPGLFDRDCHFRLGAKARLQSLAKELAKTQARIMVRVIGIADEEPATWPWSPQRTPEALGFQRAHCATTYLLHLGILPSENLSAAPGSPADRPFPSPNRNNRSVIIQIVADSSNDMTPRTFK